MAALETQTLSDDGHRIKAVLKSGVTPELIQRLDSFFELMPPLELRDHLIELYHHYIQHEHESLPHNFSHMADGMILLLDFLKFANEERKSQHSETEVTAGEK